MMRFLFTIAVASGMMWTALAGDVILGVNGKTKHQIIVPYQYDNPVSQVAVEGAAKLIQEAFAANSVKLDIVKESQKDKEKHGIYLGATKFAKGNGVDISKLNNWQNTHKAVGKDIIIAGNDKPNPITAEMPSGRERVPYLVTLHSTAEFLYRYAGTRFLKPGNDGIEYLPLPAISVPDNLNTTQEPFFLEHDFLPGRSNPGEIFNIANHAIRFQKVWSGGGHQHNVAVPNEKYGKSNPEYFIQTGGGLRQKNTQLLCYSNKDVRELIYKHILEKCDEGYDIVEVGQPDGFAPCACKECFELYGIRPVTKPENGAVWYADPAWNEKLWTMHRDMALRLMKDRPGKKMMISAYSVTAKPPQTVKEFPENVIVDMMRSTPEYFKAWESIKVPGSYAAYLYTWGSFHLTGLTPKNEVSYFGRENDLFREKNVRVVQVNGRPYQYGLEGPNIYVYLRLSSYPQLKNADDLYREYLEASFREAETPMRRFFTKLQNALMLYDINDDYIKKMGRDPIRLMGIIYTPELMNSMEEELGRAEKTATQQKVKNRIATVRGEFDFLKQIVNVIYCWHNYNNKKDQAALNQLLDALDARNKHLDELISKKGTPYNPIGNSSKEYFNPRNVLGIPPFNWDVAKMRKEGDASLKGKSMKAVLTEAVPTLDSQVWKKAEIQKMGKVRGAEAELHADTSFQILYDKDNLYIKVSGAQEPALMKFESRGRDAEIWLAESIVINLSPIADKSQYYYLTYEPTDNSFADAEHGFITDTYDPRYGWNDWTWNGDWKYTNKLEPKNSKWESMTTIPFKTLKASAPKAGTMWYFNIGRVHFYPGADGKAGRENSVWTGIMNPSKVPGDGSLGELIFE
jgi:hypothetical protein